MYIPIKILQLISTLKYSSTFKFIMNLLKLRTLVDKSFKLIKFIRFVYTVEYI